MRANCSLASRMNSLFANRDAFERGLRQSAEAPLAAFQQFDGLTVEHGDRRQLGKSSRQARVVVRKAAWLVGKPQCTDDEPFDRHRRKQDTVRGKCPPGSHCAHSQRDRSCRRSCRSRRPADADPRSGIGRTTSRRAGLFSQIQKHRRFIRLVFTGQGHVASRRSDRAAAGFKIAWRRP